MPTVRDAWESLPLVEAEKPVPQPFLLPILSRRQLVKYGILIALWACATIYFWAWWLQPSHVIALPRYLMVTFGLFWLTFLQVYFLAMFLRSRRASDRLDELDGALVAMIVTKTPSEPFSVVQETLEAMLAQDYPHDTWLADEQPTPETEAWCAEHGVLISTRFNVAEYHQAQWPRRTRCKEGNLAYFYDEFGYYNYDFVAQLDSDHVPTKSYLREILKPFADDRVGYVSAPSICSSNAGDSWAARTRLYAESMFHGVLQSGYSNGWAPMCIGSHYAVRTEALRDVGGLGPELAEDHSTSMILNSGGWRGVHAIDAIAVGAGPANITDMITQEFQWSRSLMTLLLRYTPMFYGGLRPVLKFQFIFSQLWYPFFAIFMMMMYLLPIIAVLFDVQFAAVTYPAFLGHMLPGALLLIAIAIIIRNDGLFRPYSASVLSWEKALFPCAQWPWVMWGCIMAVKDHLTGQFVDFRITPKGEAAHAVLPIKVVLPYFVLAAGSLLPVLFVTDLQSAVGFYVLAMINAVLYTSLLLVITWDYLSKVYAMGELALTTAGKYALPSVLLIAMLVSAGWLRGEQSLYALADGTRPFQLTKPQFAVSGAGMAASGSVQYVFDFEWSRE